MPNPNGNRRHCKVDLCHAFASKDGWCKKHRPAWSERIGKKAYIRDNYIDSYGQGFKSGPFFGEGYAIVRDKCRAVEGD